ncbi:MAG: FapA family protein [Treponema sp.]|nr:FapA family protein [Treponema sp.]
MEKEDSSPGEKPDTQNPQSILLGNRNDGNLSITFLDNDMEVRADFIPPLGKGTPLTMEQVQGILEKLNILYGVRRDAVEEALDQCNTSRKLIKDVVVAKGAPPVSEITEYFEINPHLNQISAPADDKSRIDYRSRSPFIIVKKDQALARLRPRRAGKEGKNVHGVVLPYAVVRPEGVSGGANTRNDGKLILAEINGQLIENQRELSVQDSLVIKGAVGYGTGNIIFPGDVVIEGPVSDGFKIYSGGSITIKQTFDVTDVVTKGDLNVAGGIIGRGAALVKAGGAVRTKFIENCRLAARKTITVDSGIINSSIFTLENINLGEKGMILGGEAYAVHGIKAGGIGKKTGKAPRLHCGIDFTAQQEKEKNNNQLRILAAKLAKIREMIAAPEGSAEQREKMEELLHRLEAEQQKAAARVSDLLGQINTDEDAAVEVIGEIVAGTLIEICQVALFVAEPLRRVRIRLDKATGKVISETL